MNEKLQRLIEEYRSEIREPLEIADALLAAYELGYKDGANRQHHFEVVAAKEAAK